MDLERRKRKEEFEQHLLNKQLYGQPMSRQSRSLDQWIDGKVAIELKEKLAKLNEELL